jgi:hypothetical protein
MTTLRMLLLLLMMSSYETPNLETGLREWGCCCIFFVKMLMMMSWGVWR